MSENALISVIVPVYNVEKYIDKCMESIRNQTYQNLEIILVDDESPDNCPQICDNYAKKDNRIKVIHKKNAGLGFARNSGLDVATGEFVAFVDSDDYLDLNRFKNMIDLIKQSNADVCLEGMCREGNGKVEILSNVFAGTCFEGEEIINTLLPALIGADQTDKHYVGVSVCRGLYKRSLIENNKVRFESERLWASEDMIFNLSLYKYVNKAIMSGDSGYYYRLNDGSLTHTADKNKFEKYDQLYNRVVEESKEFNSANEIIKRIQLTYVFDYKAVMKEFANQLDGKESIKLFKDITYRKLFSKVIKDYSTKNLPIKKRLFFYAARRHMGKALYYMIKKNNRR